MTKRTRRTLYGRRKGPKLSAHQLQLLEHLLPQFELKLQRGLDPAAYFLPPPMWGGRNAERSESISSGGNSTNGPHPLATLATSPQGGGEIHDAWLEVGFGGGEHLVWQARQHSNVGLIGAEPYVNGVVKLLSQQEGGPLPNIRIYTGDARDILEALPDASLDRLFILFPDPWPKTRHHKRRFIQMDTLNELSRVMKAGAELRFASDDAGYVEWTLERLMAHPAFEWTATRAADWCARPADWPPTRYEAKQLHGKPAFLNFHRR
ncbi:MAG TPA: tRNA (guanine(46)-N(7))-methyltransferase TrmB [Rhizomicrobium sp.]|jgi:tRNA (guanine-N7-)-methyltransferase|nr:tRNA (guanine(46)-N(7))-methyltransferase TrmB [Rhizomicrobium sp.]